MREHFRQAFTLIELLAAIAVIALLTALVFPVFTRIREGARKAPCFSNLRQISSAWQMYSQDYDEMTPGGAYARFATAGSGTSVDGKRYTPLWPLLSYTKSEAIFVCPTQLGWDFSTTNAALDTHRPRQGSYASNYELVGISLAKIDDSTRMIAFCDSYNPWQDCIHDCSNVTGSGSSFVWDRIGRGCYQGDCTKPTDWHNGGICSAFSDGHVKWKPLSRIFYKNWALDLSETDLHYDRPITHDW